MPSPKQSKPSTPRYCAIIFSKSSGKISILAEFSWTRTRNCLNFFSRKNSSAKKESVELSEIAKELNKITNTKAKKSENNSSGGGSGGSIKISGKKSFFAGVKDSSIEAKGSNLNVKTRALIQVGYIPMAGGGTGSGGAKGGNPKNRSDKINSEHGSQDRKRSKEKISPTPDIKTISR